MGAALIAFASVHVVPGGASVVRTRRNRSAFGAGFLMAAGLSLGELPAAGLSLGELPAAGQAFFMRMKQDKVELGVAQQVQHHRHALALRAAGRRRIHNRTAMQGRHRVLRKKPDQCQQGAAPAEPRPA